MINEGVKNIIDLGICIVSIWFFIMIFFYASTKGLMDFFFLLKKLCNVVGKYYCKLDLEGMMIGYIQKQMNHF